MKYLSFFSIILISLVGVTSCTQNKEVSPLPSLVTQTDSWALWNQDTPLENSWSKETTTSKEATGSKESVDNGQNYWLILNAWNSTNFFINHMKWVGDSVSFTNTNGKNLKVKISFLGKTGNLRLSQIVLPDGTMDGPFWVETNYQLTQNGKYTLKFNENQMAWDPWSGTAQIDISIDKQ